MKLLFDENISYRVAKKLEPVTECLHVSRSGLKMPAKDAQIWNFAKKNNYIIVTFDEDFEDMSNLYGFPPKVILLRFGNSSTQELVEKLTFKLPEIKQFYDSEVYGLLEMF
ncbi:hypothetical protein GCM10011514_47790 [Emticicia aquatilis]|uniref:DUF5615 domain-containing protein n=1 Tax=Emticicia aquatilis TaxID=1537369 RepID=A0A916Z748_9BACT|nr:DUF5615 family PIN-like protein [Emticicia aquatilis]GGD78224.1 hypothetical protein GCM10011514_47790 [Emticicia aquatilis]